MFICYIFCLFLNIYFVCFEGRGIFINDNRDTGVFIVWVGEEDQMRIMAMNEGSDVRAVWDLFYTGLEAVHKGVQAQGSNFYVYFLCVNFEAQHESMSLFSFYYV